MDVAMTVIQSHSNAQWSVNLGPRNQILFGAALPFGLTFHRVKVMISAFIEAAAAAASASAADSGGPDSLTLADRQTDTQASRVGKGARRPDRPTDRPTDRPIIGLCV
jgi:hypothetical protein